MLPAVTVTAVGLTTRDWVVPPPPLQVTPLIAKLVGLVLVPLKVPLNPMVHEAPVAWLPLYERLFAVTFAPDCDQSAVQPWDTCWLPGKVKVSVQLVRGSPRFLIVTFPPNPLPPSQAFSYVTWQATAALAEVGLTTSPMAVSSNAATAVTALRQELLWGPIVCSSPL